MIYLYMILSLKGISSNLDDNNNNDYYYYNHVLQIKKLRH